MKIEFEPILSVCIPTYNGLPRVLDLIKSLLTSQAMNFEVVVNDDNSSDGTLAEIKAFFSNDIRLRFYKNQVNLGMDENFTAAADMARGKYLWLCGQDDFIMHEGLDVVIQTLVSNPDVDFIYLNHKAIDEKFSCQIKGSKISNVHNVYGIGIDSFLNRSDGDLPTFLPKFLIRKTLWDRADAKRYFGTYYCQVGVFLEASNNIRWCHHAGNYVLGLLPSNGWQVDSSKYTNIILGYFIMLSRFYNSHPSFNKKIIKDQYISHLKELFYAFLLIKKYKIKISKDMEIEFLNALSNNGLSLMAKIWQFKLPRFFWLSVWTLVTFKKYLKRFFHALGFPKLWLWKLKS